MSEPGGQGSARGTREPRPAMSRERVLRGAVALADAGGIETLTIRSLAQELGVRPMTLYYYVANKDEILDGIVDLVYEEIYVPVAGQDWRAELHERAVSARGVLRTHPWATPLMESRRTPGPANLRHHDAVLGVLRVAGFSLEATAHAYAVIDAFIYGHALQEASLPFEGPGTVSEVAGPVQELMATGEYPHMTEMVSSYYLQPGYDFADEFEFGVRMILDGLAELLEEGGGATWDAGAAGSSRAPDEGAVPGRRQDGH
jgi:AcrR family transcriptional regulator